MLRRLLLYLSTAGWARAALTRLGFARRTARRFVAGETVADAIGAIRALNAAGILATVDHLGENVTTEADADRAAEGYLCVLDELARSGVTSNISVKLTQLGLAVGESICVSNMRRILDRARRQNTFVRIDMESSEYTDRTLTVYRTLRHDYGYENVGVVIQAYLYRSEQDVRELAAEGARVRLCKGAYNEPPDRAFPRKADVDANYVRLTRLLLDAWAPIASNGGDGRIPAPVAIATHDEKVIAAARAYAADKPIRRAVFEFQMLYGIRRELQAQLVAEGYQVRVYVPFGSEWYPYFMRRLAERPANLWFFVSNLLR